MKEVQSEEQRGKKQIEKYQQSLRECGSISKGIAVMSLESYKERRKTLVQKVYLKK